MAPPTAKLASLLQEFVDARIGLAELFQRAQALLPPGSDPGAEILEWLAESEQLLRLPASRAPLVRRLRQFADQEINWTELDLWCFALAHTEALSPERLPAEPELVLLRQVLSWVDTWEEAAARPAPAMLSKLADILDEERNPARCLERLVGMLK